MFKFAWADVLIGVQRIVSTPVTSGHLTSTGLEAVGSDLARNRMALRACNCVLSLVVIAVVVWPAAVRGQTMYPEGERLRWEFVGAGSTSMNDGSSGSPTIPTLSGSSPNFLIRLNHE